jgi:hypothetical protein
MTSSPAWLRGLLNVGASSRYAAIAAACGGAGMLASPHLKLDPHLAFVACFALALGPLYFIFSSQWAMRRRLATLLDWKDQELITEAQYEDLRERALRWFRERAFGKDPLPAELPETAGISPPRRQAKPKAQKDPAQAHPPPAPPPGPAPGTPG